ncbi:MAG: hypothetical protein IPI88_17045 [Chitinophagaceae bacterium]|nr:hypothetical protein [Chitinophagaceae bacterium]
MAFTTASSSTLKLAEATTTSVMVFVIIGSSSLLQEDKLITAPDRAVNKMLFNVVFILIVFGYLFFNRK